MFSFFFFFTACGTSNRTRFLLRCVTDTPGAISSRCRLRVRSARALCCVHFFHSTSCAARAFRLARFTCRQVELAFSCFRHYGRLVAGAWKRTAGVDRGGSSSSSDSTESSLARPECSSTSAGPTSVLRATLIAGSVTEA